MQGHWAQDVSSVLEVTPLHCNSHLLLLPAAAWQYLSETARNLGVVISLERVYAR